MAAMRHRHEHGTTAEQLAEIAVATRKCAALNPGATMREQLTVADVLTSPMICDPLQLRDCCLVTDGGGAVVITSLERARDLNRSWRVFLLEVAEMLGSGTFAPKMLACKMIFVLDSGESP